ncbi:class F sortase [Salipaludibacillus keqinensis]|nr:class F sortase [Salipaludibacillus keqinensis]
MTFILTACVAENESSQHDTDNEPQVMEVSETEVLSEEFSSDEHVEKNGETIEEVEQTEETTVAETKPVEPVYSSSSQGIIPSMIEIPSIEVEAEIIHVGLEDDGAMEVPNEGDLVGWFNRGAKPGAKGNSVLAGHVDDRTGPAIFFDLKDLDVGDDIIITDEDGTVLTFQVKDREIYPYDDAPIAKVFGPSSSRNLNLITCTGEFDRNQGTHRERLVIFTELIDETPA